MKKILSILVCLITPVTFSQTFQEIDNFNRSGTEISYGDNGYYFKDTKGYFDQFTEAGIWQYTANNIIIQLQFVKKNIY